MPLVDAFSLPFLEAIEFLKKKINLPTAVGERISSEMHRKAFTIAGEMKMDVLADFHTAINKMIAEGLTIHDFRKEFDSIVEKYGWDYMGSRGWRSSVIYETNLQSAYQDGRYQQANDPDTLNAFPFWRYRTAGDTRVRPEHAAWDGTILRADDPWWDTHYPYRGDTYNWFGCRCDVEVITEDEYNELAGKPGSQTTPPGEAGQGKNESLGYKAALARKLASIPEELREAFLAEIEKNK